jgi:hypothetical protein
MDFEKAVEPGILGPIDSSSPVNVPQCNEATRLQDSKHLNKRTWTFVEVLDYLVCVDGIERTVWEGKVVHVGILIAKIADAPGFGISARELQCLTSQIDANDLTLSQVLCETRRDAARPASNVQESHLWHQLW